MRLTSAVLERTIDLLGPNGEHWGQGYYALDANNQPVNFMAEDACKFCILGAVRRSFHDVYPNFQGWADIDYTLLHQAIYNLFSDKVPNNRLDPVALNDEVAQSFDDVKHALNEALSLVKEYEEKLIAEGFDGS